MARVIDSSDDEDVPLSVMKKYTSDSDDEPLINQVQRNGTSDKENGVKPTKKRVKKDPETSKKRIKTEKTVKAEKPVKTGKTVKKETSKRVKKETTKRLTKESETPKRVKSETAKPAKKENGLTASQEEEETVKAEEEQDEQDETYRWWEQINEDNSVKWTTLEHNGVLFPPPYEPLPSNVKLLYDGKPVELSVEAEEVAGFFGAMLSSDHTQNPVFQSNFFNDFNQVVAETGGAKVAGQHVKTLAEFDKCDFSQIFEHYEAARNAKKALSAAEKKALKAEKDTLEENYKTCIIDGRKEQIGNFRIEPPGLFRGRGAHPKTGKLKARVKPEQVTINIGSEAKVPAPPEGHEWAEVKHDNTVAWLATWKENINNNVKYVLFAQSSSLKGMSDFKKFEKARELKQHVDRIRKDYFKELDDKVMEKRQRATAMYLIDQFALRAGGEKGDDEADTVGCCSLRYEHISLEEPDKVHFDFLGKDSIRYQQTMTVDKRVFRNLRIFKKAPKKEGDDIFDRLDPPLLNRHLQSYLPGLTAKVFRTFNASFTMQQQLDLIENKGSVNVKVVAFNAANRAVAVLCNHQRTVSKNHETSVGKINDRILELEWLKIRAKKQMLEQEPELKKKRAAYFADLDLLEPEKVAEIHEKVLEREKIKIERKFAKDNLKLQQDGEKVMPESELHSRLKALDVMKKEFAAELKTGKVVGGRAMSVEKLEQQVEKYQERIQNVSLQLKDKEDNSTVALGTSKMNYIDPRLPVMFSKKYNVPIEKLFTKTLREKFKWAIESAGADWRF